MAVVAPITTTPFQRVLKKYGFRFSDHIEEEPGVGIMGKADVWIHPRFDVAVILDGEYAGTDLYTEKKYPKETFDWEIEAEGKTVNWGKKAKTLDAALKRIGIPARKRKRKKRWGR